MGACFPDDPPDATLGRVPGTTYATACGQPIDRCPQNCDGGCIGAATPPHTVRYLAGGIEDRESAALVTVRVTGDKLRPVLLDVAGTGGFATVALSRSQATRLSAALSESWHLHPENDDALRSGAGAAP